MTIKRKWFIFYLLIVIGSIVKMKGIETHGLFATLLCFPIMVFVKRVRDLYFILDSLDFKSSKEYAVSKSLYIGKGIESVVLAFNVMNYFVMVITINVLMHMMGLLSYLKLGDEPFDEVFLAVDFGIVTFIFVYLLIRFCWWLKKIDSKLYPVKAKLFTMAFLILITHCIYLFSMWHWNGRIIFAISMIAFAVMISIMLFGWSHLRELVERNAEGVIKQQAMKPSGRFVILTKDNQTKEFSCDIYYPVLLLDGSILIRKAEEKEFTIRFSRNEIKSYRFQ